MPNEYPRFFTVKFKDCDGLSVLVIHRVGDAEGGAMFKCHYRENGEPIETVVELVLLDGARESVEPVETRKNETLDASDVLFSDGPANETVWKKEETQLLFADFQQPAEEDMPKLLRLLNVTESLTLHEEVLEEARSDSKKVTYNETSDRGRPTRALMRHSLKPGDRLLLQCANVSGDHRPDVHWYVANESVDFLEERSQVIIKILLEIPSRDNHLIAC